MLPRDYGQRSAKESARLGLPDGYKLFSPYPFSGVNQVASRTSMNDAQFFWSENFVKIGDGKLRTAWDAGDSIFTAPAGKSIVYFIFYNLAAVDYCAVFLSDGTAVQINVNTLAQTVISSQLNTFYNGGQIPIASQWGAQYLVIANNITPDSYWVWDGTVLYFAGTIGPNPTITNGGSGYSSKPTVTAYGGSGTGVVVTPTIVNGSVVSLLVNNPGTGFLPGDVVQFAFSGGGSDNSAILQAILASATVDHIQLIEPGTGFTPGVYNLAFSGGGGGTGAAGTYTVDSTGTIVSVNLSSNGSGYTSTPSVSFPSGGGTGAAAIAILSSGSVASVTVINGGTGFTGTPTLTFQGGNGTGATATANVSGGSISSVTVTNGGTNYTSAPAVIVESGVNHAAAATATIMPFGVSGSSMEIFNNRVWLPFPNQQGSQVNGNTFLVSAPSSLTDFATSDGGLTFTDTSRYLRKQFTNIRQSNGYLYPFGDSSVDVISNVQTSGNPVTTTFNYQNTDPQIGTGWRDSLQDFSRTILFANQFGVYGLYGGSVTKISDDIDEIFTNAVFPSGGGLTPTSAVSNMFTKKIYLLLLTVTDPTIEATRNVMIGWNQKEWRVFSQSPGLTIIGTQEIDSNLIAWGTDGKKLYPLFNQPSASLGKTLSSKLYGSDAAFIQKQSMALYIQAQDKSQNATGIELEVTLDTEGSLGRGTSFDLPGGNISIVAPPPVENFVAVNSGDIYGNMLGFTMSSKSPDFVLNYLGIGYIDVFGGFGSNPALTAEGE